MNRPSNVPPQQPPPPTPNMSARHIHGHHNMRAPPPALQQIGPPAPHGLPMGFGQGPTMPPNLQQQQRPNRAQNYHAYMENPNSGIGGGGGGIPYVLYNRMGGGANQVSKKYHHSSLNKPRSSKPHAPESHVHQQHLHHQTPLKQQQQQQHHSYTVAAPPCLKEMPANHSTSSSVAAVTNLQIASNETTTTRKPLQPMPQTQECYASASKKFPEISRQFDLNFQPTATITPPVVANASLSSSLALTTDTKRDVVVEEFPLTSLKTLSLADRTEDPQDVCIPKKDDDSIKTNVEENEEMKTLVGADVEHKPDTKEEAEEESSQDVDKLEENDFKSSREKTPMCLVNDLARFNKISFQYRLTGENGPAHCKRFTVTLKLGDEEYVAEGLKIKEAQHLAAKEAIKKTKYKHPVPRTTRRIDEQAPSRVNVTPTVELNALAMKLGLQTYYIFDPRQSAANVPDNKIVVGPNEKALIPPRYRGAPALPMGVQNQLHGGSNVRYGGGGGGTFVPNLAHHNPALMHVQQAAAAAAAGHHHHRGNFPHCYPVLPPHMMAAASQHHHAAALFSTPCRITLIVGTQKFVGIGRTIQHAKHDAAAQAIESLKVEMNSQQKENDDEKSDDVDNKSPISLVFEIGIKRNLPVDFKILREDGPAHMRTFTTACIVGQIVTEAEGTGKKISKKKAAHKMLEELNKLPPVVTPTTTPTKRVRTKTAAPRKSHAKQQQQQQGSDNKETSSRPRAGVDVGDKPKKRSSDSESTDPLNPITKLIELFQHNKEKEPVFKLITDGGKERSRQRQFVVEVSSDTATARGVGNSKKSARRNAAQNFLMSLGLDVKDKAAPTEQQNEDVTVNSNNEKAAIVSKPNTELSLRKGNDTKKTEDVVVHELPKAEATNAAASEKDVVAQPLEKPETSNLTSAPPAARIASAGSNTTTTTTSKASGLYMKDKLLYLARLMGFEVDFSDYPKGNHNEFLSIVMISTNPPQICHGIGANAQESQEDAASNALKILSEMGLNK